MIVFKLDDLFWEHRMTAQEVKRATGLSATTLSNIRNGKNTNISVKTLDKLCQVFKCPLSDIMEYVPDVSSN